MKTGATIAQFSAVPVLTINSGGSDSMFTSTDFGRAFLASRLVGFITGITALAGLGVVSVTVGTGVSFTVLASTNIGVALIS